MIMCDNELDENGIMQKFINSNLAKILKETIINLWNCFDKTL